MRRELLDLMLPWIDHVAVDSNAWWCDGPVSLWIALLYESMGQPRHARELLEPSRRAITNLNDVRASRRLKGLVQRLETTDSAIDRVDLSDRELKVLQMLSAGATNAAIAAELNYSVSTVRNATVSVYRKLGASGRPEAVARAITLGLLTADDIG